MGGCGYIGSALFQYLCAKGIKVDTVDSELFGNNSNPNNIKMDFDKLTKENLSQYSTVVLLAAHSSVPMAAAFPADALENNLVKFQRLLDKLDKQTFIYASSSSVYSGSGSLAVNEDWQNFKPNTVYDLTKYANDALASFTNLNYYGLRFGTVCGASPNLRTELMLNSMFVKAMQHGQIFVQNKNIHRPILGIQDLCRSLELIIRCSGKAERGVYNLASFNTTVLQIAQAVQEITGAEIVFGLDTPTYDFSLSTKKFEKTFGYQFKETPFSIVSQLKEQRETMGLFVRGTTIKKKINSYQLASEKTPFIMEKQVNRESLLNL